MSRVREHRCLSLLGLLVLSLALGAASAGATCEEGQQKAVLKLTPITWTFKVVNAETKFTVENAGNAIIEDLTVEFVPETTKFQISGTNCEAQLLAKETCGVTVKCLELGKKAFLVAESKAKVTSSTSEVKS